MLNSNEIQTAAHAITAAAAAACNEGLLSPDENLEIARGVADAAATASERLSSL